MTHHSPITSLMVHTIPDSQINAAPIPHSFSTKTSYTSNHWPSRTPPFSLPLQDTHHSRHPPSDLRLRFQVPKRRSRLNARRLSHPYGWTLSLPVWVSGARGLRACADPYRAAWTLRILSGFVQQAMWPPPRPVCEWETPCCGSLQFRTRRNSFIPSCAQAAPRLWGRGSDGKEDYTNQWGANFAERSYRSAGEY